MMHVTRIGIMRDQSLKSQNVQTYENILQSVLRKMEDSGHMVIGCNLMDSTIPGEVAQCYVFSQLIEMPAPPAEQSKIFTPGS